MSNLNKPGIQAENQSQVVDNQAITPPPPAKIVPE